jgi:hypothetical protein
MLLVSFFIFAVGGTASAFGQTAPVQDLGLVKTPNGITLQCYQVATPAGYCAGLITLQPDGSVKAQYFTTVAEYDAAVCSMSSVMDYQETITTERSWGAETSSTGGMSVLGSRPVTYTARLYQGGTSYNMLSSRLTWSYNGSAVTSATYWASSGWTSPWSNYGSCSVSLGSVPAASVLLDCTQFYKALIGGTTFYNCLRNKIRGYGTGSYYTGESTFAVDYRLSGWTYGYTIS